MAIDYLIECVTYNNNQIDTVRWYTVVNNKPSKPAKSKTRAEVINAIENGRDIRTIYKKDGKWKLGSQVKHYTLNGITYITTEGNETTRDNLGEIAKC